MEQWGGDGAMGMVIALAMGVASEGLQVQGGCKWYLCLSHLATFSALKVALLLLSLSATVVLSSHMNTNKT